jgi:hypothetical protein
MQFLNYDAMLKNMPIHQSFYLRGVLNSLLPEFMDPYDRAITENNISGESIEMLRGLVRDLVPNFDEAEEGFVGSFGYDDINKKYNLKNLLRQEGLDVDTFEKQVKMGLGLFDVYKENGRIVIKDQYDFPTIGEWKEFNELKTLKDYAQASIQQPRKTPYFVARAYGERMIAEGDEGNLKINITIPDKPQVIDIDFDNDIEPNAASFVFEGPMTNMRQKLWNKFTGMFSSSDNAEPLMPLPKSKPERTVDIPLPASKQDMLAKRDAMQSGQAEAFSENIA